MGQFLRHIAGPIRHVYRHTGHFRRQHAGFGIRTRSAEISRIPRFKRLDGNGPADDVPGGNFDKNEFLHVIFLDDDARKFAASFSFNESDRRPVPFKQCFGFFKKFAIYISRLTVNAYSKYGAATVCFNVLRDTIRVYFCSFTQLNGNFYRPAEESNYIRRRYGQFGISRGNVRSESRHVREKCFKLQKSQFRRAAQDKEDLLHVFRKWK